MGVRIRYKVLALVLFTSALLTATLVGVANLYLEHEFGKQERDSLRAAIMQTQAWVERMALGSYQLAQNLQKEWVPSEPGLVRRKDILPSKEHLLFVFDSSGALTHWQCQGECPEDLVAMMGNHVKRSFGRDSTPVFGIVAAHQGYFAMGVMRNLAVGERVDDHAVPSPGGQGVTELLPSQSAPRDSLLVLTYVKRDSVDAMIQVAQFAEVAPVSVWARMPRTVFLKGKEGLRFWMYGMAIASLLVTLVLFAFLDRSVLRRIEILRKDVEKIGEGKEKSQRVRSQGSDDIGILANQINRTLTELEVVHETKERYKLFDNVTRLANRANFMSRLQESLSRRTSHSLAIIVINLDRFQRINDALGWAVGDDVLRDVTMRLTRVQGNNFLARVGGDKFALLIEGDQNVDLLTHMAFEMERDLSQPVKLHGYREMHLSASIGIAMGDDFEGLGPEEAIRRAEVAMRKAQLDGGAKVALFNSELDLKARERMELERDMTNALQKKEFLVMYQPIVLLGAPGSNGRTLAGFESLVRWRHPTKGIINPVDFIPMAEDSGLIVDIGEHVLRESCRQMMEWDRTLPGLKSPFVSVNLSVRQFRDPFLLEKIKDALADSLFPYKRLKLEITESAMMDDPTEFKKRLAQLSEMGIRLSLDDFGTGYSSLRYLDEFPVNNLKVDKSFVDRIGTNQNPAIVRSVVKLAHNMGLDVVAEGIERDDQAEALRQLRCRFGQGFLFGKPALACNLDAYLEEQVLLIDEISKIAIL